MNTGLLVAVRGHNRLRNAYAATAGNVLSLAIGIGHIVCIFTQCQSSPSSVTDDGGNTYTRLQDGGPGYGCSAYYTVATHTATTVTGNGGGTFFANIAGAAIGLGATAQGASAMALSSDVVSVTTTKNNSVVLGVVQGFDSGAGGFTVAAGIQKALSVCTVTPVDGRKNQVILLSSAVVPSSGTSTTLSCTAPRTFGYYNALSIEVKF